jgi:hypothetical protein
MAPVPGVPGTQVASFDFASPAAPVARGTLWFPGAGHVVAATDTFLFVAVADDSPAWPWRSDIAGARYLSARRNGRHLGPDSLSREGFPTGRASTCGTMR